MTSTEPVTTGQVLWEPSAQRVVASAMDQFRRSVEERFEVRLEDSVALQRWSCERLDAFWSHVWDWCGIAGDKGSGATVTWTPGTPLRAARFLPESAASYAANLASGDRHPGANQAAVVYRAEGQPRRSLTWAQLRARVKAVADRLAQASVGPGETVAAWLPNGFDALVVMLAANALGATFTSTSPDFGVAGVVDRFGQVAPAALVVPDGYRYSGREHHRLQHLPDLLAELPSVRLVLVSAELASDADALDLPTGLAAGPDGPSVAIEPVPEPAADAPDPGVDWMRPARYDDPAFVLYSSGTTGPPKCLVHSGTGLLVKHAVEHALGCDIRAGDTAFYFTTCGWMMWNWLVSALARGATIVLYDGNPLHEPTSLWDLAEAERVSFFGASARYYDACAQAGVRPGSTHDLSALRTIASTGSPLSPEAYAYLYSEVASDVHLASISGGTDLCGCFVMGDPTRPVRAGEIQGPALGMAVDVWDEAGQSLRGEPGVRGELVCTEPFPTMPLSFLGGDLAEAEARYDAAYFDRFPGIWAQGDFASWTDAGGIVIHGRSDATLNAGGVRIGTAELYRQAEQLDWVAESLAVGQEWERDTRIVLFVRTVDGSAPTPEQEDELRRRIRLQCSPRHVPARIVGVQDLPRTRSGKLAELAVADVVNGRPVRNTSALANPESLAEFEDLPPLRQ